MRGRSSRVALRSLDVREFKRLRAIERGGHTTEKSCMAQDAVESVRKRLELGCDFPRRVVQIRKADLDRKKGDFLNTADPCRRGGGTSLVHVEAYEQGKLVVEHTAIRTSIENNRKNWRHLSRVNKSDAEHRPHDAACRSRIGELVARTRRGQ